MRFKDIYSCVDKNDLFIPSKEEQEKLIAEMLSVYTSAKVLHYCWTAFRWKECFVTG
ncbi:MAG: hypothetical protein NC124_13515 [Clostridium sp.]|nr:hypothetical protein [Clostridium sp.]